MTAARVLRLLTRLLTLIVLAASGSYLMVYLYYWEWNRALVSGVFFVGAEVAFVASLLHTRLDRLERRLGHSQPSAVARSFGQPLDHRSQPRDPFPWLQPDRGTFVFIPVLLGAGVILSAIAHLVQRVATSTEESMVVRGAAPHLAQLAPPEGGLVPPPGGDRVPAHRLLDEAPTPATTGWREAVGWMAAVLVGGLLLWGAIDVLADATQARPDPDLEGFASVLELEVSAADGVAGRADADALVVACRPRLPAGAEVTRTEAIGEGRVQLTIEPALGRTGMRRYQGCLEDATIDLVEAEVIWVDRVPVEQRP